MQSSVPEILKYASLVGTLGAVLFNAGRQSEKIDELFTKAYASDSDVKDMKNVVYDIHGKVSAIERDMQHLLKRQ
jgi:hypothetical protein